MIFTKVRRVFPSAFWGKFLDKFFQFYSKIAFKIFKVLFKSLQLLPANKPIILSWRFFSTAFVLFSTSTISRSDKERPRAILNRLSMPEFFSPLSASPNFISPFFGNQRFPLLSFSGYLFLVKSIPLFSGRGKNPPAASGCVLPGSRWKALFQYRVRQLQ